MWIGRARPAFAVYHEPASDPHPLAVLFCSPFGWEDMGSYAVRRLWAQRLAQAGHPVLRFDLPGTGQSAGEPGDADHLRHWLAAIDECARWLRQSSDSDAVAAIGIGMGALLALHASCGGAPLDDLVLWGLPSSGRALVRTMRAFAKLQVEAQTGDDPALASGWLQSGGYMLSAETMDELGALRLDEPPHDRLRRVLLLTDGGEVAKEQSGLASRLGEAGVSVEVAVGEGYADMIDSPHLSVAPDRTMERVGEWLAGMRARSASPGGEKPVAEQEIDLEVEGALVRERPYVVSGAAGDMFGILATPVGRPMRDDACVVCLPAFAERCVGPSRMWVEIARRHAARGVPVLRIDLESIGDSGGCPDDMRAPNAIHDPDRVAQIQRVMDALAQQDERDRFALIGLCAGGYWAQAAAASDGRVVGVLALNPSASSWARDVLRRDAALRVFAVLSPGWWARVMRGEVSSNGFKTVARGLRYVAMAAVRRIRGRPVRPSADGARGEDPFAFTYRSLIASLEGRGGRMICAVGRSEHAYRSIELEGLSDEPESGPSFKLHRFAHEDHNLRSASDQQVVHALVDELLGGH